MRNTSCPSACPTCRKAPNEAGDMPNRSAMAQRLDVQIARREAEATASALGLSQATGFVNVLDAGYANKSVSGAPRENGYRDRARAADLRLGRRPHRARPKRCTCRPSTAPPTAPIRARSEVREA